MLKTIGILAHVDAGKTSFSEQLLFHAKEIKIAGRVDHQNTYLDNHVIERERGLTVYSDQASFKWNDSTYTIIDTPGHVDFSPEMERAVQVMDYAILLISAVDGIQAHTETIWHILRKHNVPTFFFFNKMDREEASKEKILKDIQTYLSANAFYLPSTYMKEEMEDGLIEWIAERDDQLLQTYLSDGYDASLWHATLKQQIKSGEWFPCFAGSALHDRGIHECFDQLDQLSETKYDEQAPFAGRVYKIRHDEHGNRLTFVKALAGTLSVRDEVCTKEETVEKVTQLYRAQCSHFEAVPHVQAGELFAVSGFSNCHVGDGIGAYTEVNVFELMPTLKAQVVYDDQLHEKEVLHHFRLLDREEPSLQVEWNEYFQEIYVHVMGVIQLEVIRATIQERFGYTVSFGKPHILYKESLQSEVIGYGHFEPLRHYAEVHIQIEPQERNSGVTFETICHESDLSNSYQRQVEQHVLENSHHGLLTGSPLTDVKCTLLTGRAHKEHTSGGDFKEAVYRALRQGLEKAENILLEPYYHVTIKVDQVHVGRVLADLTRANGSFEPPETIGTLTQVTGRVPVASFMDYPTTFASFTRGRGVLRLDYGGYDRCHNEQEVIKQIAYNKDSDPAYTSSSIFCAKGSGYSVPWDEAEEMMHCLK